MGYGKKYKALLEAIAEEADAIASRYFRAAENARGTQAGWHGGDAGGQGSGSDGARQGDGERVAAGCAGGEEMGGESAKASAAQNGRAAHDH